MSETTESTDSTLAQTTNTSPREHFEKTLLPNITRIVTQHMPAEYLGEIKLSDTYPNPEILAADLNIYWAPNPLPADQWPLVGNTKIHFNLPMGETAENLAQQILNIISDIAKRDKDFVNAWNRQHGTASNAMRTAINWEQSMRFRCKLAAGRISKRLPANFTAQITIPDHATEILSIRDYQAEAELTIEGNSNKPTGTYPILLSSSDSNSVEDITNYFCKHTSLKQLLKPESEGE